MLLPFLFFGAFCVFLSESEERKQLVEVEGDNLQGSKGEPDNDNEVVDDVINEDDDVFQEDGEEKDGVQEFGFGERRRSTASVR